MSIVTWFVIFVAVLLGGLWLAFWQHVAKCRGAAAADRIANHERCVLAVEESSSRGEYLHQAR